LQALAEEQKRSISEARSAAKEYDILKASERLRDVTNSLNAFVEQKNREAQEQEWRFKTRSLVVQWCLFGATFAAFCAAFWYAHVASQQKDTMDKQWSTMDNSFKEIQKQTGPITDSAKAAKDAAKAAQQSASVASKDLVLGQRAWMVTEFTGTHIDNSGYVLQDAKIENRGKTPASHVHEEFMIVPVQADTIPQFDFPTWKYSANGPVIFPNSPIPFSFGVGRAAADNPEHGIPTPIDKAKFDRRELLLVVYGRITYDDIFGRHHFAHICAPQWTAYTTVGYSTAASKACADYNQIDQEQ
jgi:hypothetical protein